jgi:hypothetical protein
MRLDEFVMTLHVLVLCDYCGRRHPTRITLNLDDGLSEKQTVAEAFKEKPLPLKLAKLLMPRIGEVRNASRPQ